MKVVGGPPGRETVLLGLKGGSVIKILVDNQFPITLIKQHTPIRNLDISANKQRLAIINDNAQVLV